MKNILLVGLLGFICSNTFGQINMDNYITSYSDDKVSNKIIFVVAIPKNGTYTDRYAADENFKTIKQQNKAFELLENDDDETPVYFTTDSSDTHLFINGIYKQNAHDYEYRITENKKRELVGWQSITQFTTDSLKISDFKKGMAYLGGYKTSLGNFLFIELRKKGNTKNIATQAIFWIQTKPAIFDIFTSKEFNIFITKVNRFYGFEQLSPEDKDRWSRQYPPNEIDTNTFLPKELIVEPKEKNIIFYLKTDAFDRTALEYRLIKDNKVLQNWQANDCDNNFIWLKNLEFGDYAIQIRLAIQRHNVLEYPFVIKAEWYQTGRFKAIIGALSFIIIVFFTLLYVLWKNRQKLASAQRDKERIGNELKSIRSQLNPHFVFNALASIQGLINKNDVPLANYYLTEFSNLLRESLLSNEKEFVPLSIELKTLETYIKLEQLRFPFAYSISVDEHLNTHDIEIPYLLLQPLVENAIKHGVSNLYEKGSISLNIYPKGKDLGIDLSDNGKGFDTQAATNGYGLKLTKERIGLLSAANSYQPVQFDIVSNNDGTNAHILFKNWL
jgi:two-component system, LytTR family, sensor kinase